MLLRISAFALLLASASLFAAERQDAGAIHQAVEAFLRQESAGLPGKVDVEVNAVDSRLSLPRCTQLQPFIPPGAKLWGRTSVGVRCLGANPWSIYLPVQIRVTGVYLAAARPIGQGQMLAADDVVASTGELTQMPLGVLVSPTQAIGRVMVNSIVGGQALRQDMLRSPVIVLSNQPVKLVSKGPGFVVSAEGRALSNAADGQTVQVRTMSGQIIAGVVRAGPLVEVF